MKQRFTNNVHLAGYLYQSKLEKRVTGSQSKNPGTEYIGGSIDVATDEDCTNVVTITYSYVVPLTKNGKENSTYTFLSNVMNGVYKSVMEHGKENAVKVRCDTSFELNEFYTDRNGEESFVSQKRCAGGFVHVDNSIFSETDTTPRNRFECDMVITGTKRVEANEERNIPEKLVIKGCIFNFAKAMLPVEFNVYMPEAMDYFENADISSANPMFTTIGGQIVSQAIERKVETASAFGAPVVKTYTSTRKDMEVNWATGEELPWDDETTITADELKKLMQDRELKLASIKSDWEKRKIEKQQKASAFANPPAGQFNF